MKRGMGSSTTRIDREKHEEDVAEHVVKGVRASYAPHVSRSVVTVAVQPWSDGPVVPPERVRGLGDSHDDAIVIVRRRRPL